MDYPHSGPNDIEDLANNVLGKYPLLDVFASDTQERFNTHTHKPLQIILYQTREPVTKTSPVVTLWQQVNATWPHKPGMAVTTRTSACPLQCTKSRSGWRAKGSWLKSCKTNLLAMLDPARPNGSWPIATKVLASGVSPILALRWGLEFEHNLGWKDKIWKLFFEEISAFSFDMRRFFMLYHVIKRCWKDSQLSKFALPLSPQKVSASAPLIFEAPNELQLVADRPPRAERQRYWEARQKQAVYKAAARLWANGVEISIAIEIVKAAMRESGELSTWCVLKLV